MYIHSVSHAHFVWLHIVQSSHACVHAWLKRFEDVKRCVQCLCRDSLSLALSLLMFHPSASPLSDILFLDTARQSLINTELLPVCPDPQSRVRRTPALVRITLATWPNRSTLHFSQCRAFDHRSSHANACCSRLECVAQLVSSTTIWCV